MEDMNVTASGYDFGAAHAAMRRYVDGNILSGVSSAVLVGRDLVDVNCVGWADKEAQTPLRVDHIFRVFSKYQADYILCGAAAVRRRPLPTR
jgi:hypothetical protein